MISSFCQSVCLFVCTSVCMAVTAVEAVGYPLDNNRALTFSSVYLPRCGQYVLYTKKFRSLVVLPGIGSTILAIALIMTVGVVCN